MRPSELGHAGKRKIKAWEACAKWIAALQRFIIYLDIAGKATIGWGHLCTVAELAAKTFVAGLTQAECDALFDVDVRRYVDAVRAAVKVTISQNAFDALCVLCFNIGTAGLSSSTLVRLINSGASRATLEPWWVCWNKIVDPKTKQKRADAGLTSRRRDELALFFTPDTEEHEHVDPDEAERDRQKCLELHCEELLDDNDRATLAAINFAHRYDWDDEHNPDGSRVRRDDDKNS